MQCFGDIYPLVRTHAVYDHLCWFPSIGSSNTKSSSRDPIKTRADNGCDGFFCVLINTQCDIVLPGATVINWLLSLRTTIGSSVCFCPSPNCWRTLCCRRKGYLRATLENVRVINRCVTKYSSLLCCNILLSSVSWIPYFYVFVFYVLWSFSFVTTIKQLNYLLKLFPQFET